MFVPLNDARWAAKGYLGTIEAPKGPCIVEAVSARWKIVVVLETVVADDFIQYRRPERKKGPHFCLEGVMTKLAYSEVERKD